MIACSRMYNLTPETQAAWTAIFRHVADAAGVAFEIVDHPAPAPLEDLWARPDGVCVFMCGYPYAMAEPRPQIVAVPVPSPERYGGRPVYFTDLVVRDDAPYATLADTFGGRVAWTDEHSHSGFNALRHHLLAHRTPDRPTLYREAVGPLVTPIRAIRSVLDGDADVAPFDSLAHDLLRRHAPERVAGLRTIDTTAAAPMPPLVAAPGIDPGTCARLTEALLAAHTEKALAAPLADALVARFAAAAPGYYDVTLERAAEAEKAGYPMPA